jgi:hypothetical protein
VDDERSGKNGSELQMRNGAASRGEHWRVVVLTTVIAGAFLLLFAVGLPATFMESAFAQDNASLSQLAQLTIKKGFKDIGLGDICDRLHIGRGCKAYQLNAKIDAAESQKFGLPAGWQTSLDVVPQQSGTDIVITDHDDHIAYGYLIGADENLRAVTLGLSATADGKNWHWKPGPATSEIAQRFALEKAYWLAQIKDIQGLPDRKD